MLNYRQKTDPCCVRSKLYFLSQHIRNGSIDSGGVEYALSF